MRKWLGRRLGRTQAWNRQKFLDVTRSFLETTRLNRVLDLHELEPRLLFSAAPLPIPEVLPEADATTAVTTVVVDSSTQDATTAAADGAGTLSVCVDSSVTSVNATNTAASVTLNPVRELVFVDSTIDRYQDLLADLLAQAGSERELVIVTLDGDQDGVEQVSEVLGQYHDVSSIHFLTEGGEGAIRLGDTWLNAVNLAGYAAEISHWGDSLATGGDLLFYAADLAA